MQIKAVTSGNAGHSLDSFPGCAAIFHDVGPWCSAVDGLSVHCGIPAAGSWAGAWWPGVAGRAVSAEAVGAQMPAQVTLYDLAVMAAADEHHRYELSPDGVLTVTPPADPEHALLVSRIFAWFLTHGLGPERVVVDCGIDVGGGRVPDLTVWAVGQPPRPGRSGYAGTAGLGLVVEVVSPGSEVTDRVVKKAEYAAAGIGRYWIVERDAATTVHRHVLDADTGRYEPDSAGHRPLADLLDAAPDVS
jgi:Uma2 family endonuclease